VEKSSEIITQETKEGKEDIFLLPIPQSSPNWL